LLSKIFLKTGLLKEDIDKMSRGTQAFIYASIVKDMEEKKEAIDQILRVLTGENNDG